MSELDACLLARFPGTRPPDWLRRCVDTVDAPLSGPPYVIDAGARMSSLLGDVAGSLLGVLRERDPAVDGVRLTEPGNELEALIACGTGRPLVLVVSDAHRRAWQRELIGRVLARRPDAVVVGTGAARDAGLAHGSYLGTLGAGRANLTAAAEVLLGQGGTRGSAGQGQ